jgi:endogenous inhibitor of DNA gyrase (YacG/DUF329 family)
MDKKELEELKKLSGSSFGTTLRYNPELKERLIKHLDFLDHVPDNLEMRWYLQNGMMEQARCPVCGIKIVIKKDRKHCCSSRCSKKLIDPKTGLTVAQTTALKSAKTKMNTIDEKSGLSLSKLAARKANTTKKNTIDEETGLDIAQTTALKAAITRKNTIDEETGLTLSKLGGIKSAITRKNTIDEKTGLSISEIAANKSAITRKNTIDEQTGLTLSKLASKKAVETKMNTIDEETGLSISKLAARKANTTKKNTIDEETGLDIAQTTALKSAITRKNTIDEETGLTLSQLGGIKSAITRKNTVDEKTGLSISEIAANKSAITRTTTIDEQTGLTLSKLASKKAVETKMNTIDEETGLSVAQTTALKSAITRKNTIDEQTGLSVAKSSALKSAITRKNTIDPETGLTVSKAAGRKMVETKRNTIDEQTGLSVAKSSVLKSAITRKSVIDPETGLSIAQTASLKAAHTNTTTIDEKTGLTLSKMGARKRAENNFQKYVESRKCEGYEILTTFDEYFISSDRILTYRHIECGEIRSSHYRYVRCLKCFPYNKSIGENEVLNFCESLLGEMVISNDRKFIRPQELDIVIPDYGLGIEYNGLFWHSCDTVSLEDANYHLEKTTKCEENGLNLLHIFENEWQNPSKQTIWKSIIRNKLGKSNKIYARKCEIREVSSKESVSFLENNHLQGNAPASIRYGLYHDDILVALMTFGKSRFNKKIDWELIRYCNMLNTSVVGGASRLFKHFLKNHTGSIISYADRRHSQGGLYKNLGFEFSHNSKPNYYYYKDHRTLESRQKFQKHKLSVILENFDPDLTESQNMYNNGYRKIYDCGNQVWIYNDKHQKLFLFPKN